MQRKTGAAVGTPTQEVKGVAKEIAGKVQKGVGNVEESVKDDRRRV